MKLAAIAGVLLVLTCAAWVGTEVRKDQASRAECHRLEETIRSVNEIVELIAQFVERSPNFTKADARDLLDLRVRQPVCQ